MLKFAQRRRDFLERNSELGSERDDADRVVNVVLSGNVQNRFAELFATTINAKNRCKILQFNVGDAVMGFLGKTV